MKTYTLISFTEGRSGWYDRCGDWNEGEPSELSIDYFTDPKECGFMWAYQEREHETTKLLIDGMDPFEAEDYGTPEYEARMELWNEAERYRDEQSDILKAKHDEEKRKAKEAKEAREAAEQAARQAETERLERAMLRSLQTKYGGSK